MPRQFSHVSRSVNMEWGFKKNRAAVIALHKCGKSDSQILEILKPLKISRNFVYRAIKRYKELWGVEERVRSGRPRCVRTETANKRARELIRRNPLRKQKSLSRELNISPRSICLAHQGRSAHESLPAFNRTPYSRFEGDPTDKNRASLPVARRERARKHPLHGRENLHYRGALQPPERQDLCSNIL